MLRNFLSALRKTNRAVERGLRVVNFELDKLNDQLDDNLQRMRAERDERERARAENTQRPVGDTERIGRG